MKSMTKKQGSILRMVFVCSFMLTVFLSITQAEIVALWRFNENTGLTAGDDSYYNNDGVLTAATEAGDPNVPLSGTTPPSWTAGKYGSGLLFGTPVGSNFNTVDVAKSFSLKTLGSKWTFAMWVRQDEDDISYNVGGGAGYQRLISCPNYEVELGVPGWKHDYFWPYGTAALQQDIGTTGPQDTWYHLAVTYDGGAIKHYIDGSVNSTVSVSSSLNNIWDDSGWTNAPLKIGGQTWPNKDFFMGALDDVVIFNQALTQTQVETIMAGDFTGPWQELIIEDDTPITYLWDPSFIIRYKNAQVILGYDEMSYGQGSWNWQMEGTLDDPNYYGLINAGLWDGNSASIEYAGYCTVGDQITQVALGRKAFEDIKYDLTARVGGIDAVGNVVGVKFYRVDANDYNDMTLIADINTTITANETWYDIATTYTGIAADQDNRFKAVCYINEASGNPRGTAFACFDKVRIDVNEFLTCEAMADYNFGYTTDYDFNKDCRVNFDDFSEFASDWATGNNPEPAVNNGELLVNSDFYADLNLVPNNNQYAVVAPTGWQFVPVPSPADPNVAGIQNLDRNGFVQMDYQPAGGSVTVYIDANTILQQAIASPTIVNGQTYYVTAMVAGNSGAYLSMLTMSLEYVDNPTSPTTVVQVAEANFVMPENLVWRQIGFSYTADSAATGKYLRLKFDFGPNPFPGAIAAGFGVIGKASITTVKPATWPRENLLVNGDFEDYSSLPMGTNDDDGWLDLFSYVGHYTMDGIPDWDTSSNPSYYSGLQCMLWAPAPQPVQGRVSAWFLNKIEQKITSETIQSGQTYYVDYMASLNDSRYATGQLAWPEIEPNMVVDIFWLSAGQNAPTGTEGVDWGLITSLKGVATGPIKGSVTYSVPWGKWVTPETSFTATPAMAGKSLYISAYCENALTTYSTFEEVFVSKEPRLDVGAYTCYELRSKFGGSLSMDLNDDCDINFKDVLLFVDKWLDCVDPEGCE